MVATLKTTSQLIVRARSCFQTLAWQHPFFGLPAARVCIRVATVVGTTVVNTAAVDERGTVYLNPVFCWKLTKPEFMFVLAHEIMHLLLFHFARQQGRKEKRWNRATDRAINFGLVHIGLSRPAVGLMPLDQSHNGFTSEQLYEVEPEIENGAGGALPHVTGGCGVISAPIAGPSGEGETPTPRSASEVRRNWRKTANAAIRAALSAGDQAGDVLGSVLQTPPSRVKWSHILRNAFSRALSAHGCDDVSYTRRHRRSFDSMFILPGGITYKALVAVVVDTSGSVSDESLAQAVSEVEAIAKQQSIAIFLVTHDAVVQHAKWLLPGVSRTMIARTMIGRGGTLYTPAYQAVEKAAKRFDHVVHLTDGMPCEAWPTRPKNCRRLVVALIGCKQAGAVPINARVIEAEI